MTRFATATATDTALETALARALDEARAAIVVPPKLAVVFASLRYEGLWRMSELLRTHLSEVPFVGGTSASCVFGPDAYAKSGVSVSLLGGDDVEVATRTVVPTSVELLEVVAAARDIQARSDQETPKGRGELCCLAFATSRHIVGDSLVAALKKGASARAQLAGGLLSHDDETSGGLVWSDGCDTSETAVVIAGLFTERAVGISARHGWSPIGRPHKVTRADGARLVTLDGRPAIDVWLEEARAHGAKLPESNVALYLASRYELAILGTEGHGRGEPIVRGSRHIHEDGSVELFGSVPEGADVQLVTATEASMLSASRMAAMNALQGVDGRASGALGLVCTGRTLVLGESYPKEPRGLAEALGVPFGGTAVNGEIALGHRDANGFYNSSAVVVAFPE